MEVVMSVAPKRMRRKAALGTKADCRGCNSGTWSGIFFAIDEYSRGNQAYGVANVLRYL